METMAPEQDCPPGQLGHQITGQGGFFLDTGRRPFLRGMLKSKGKTELVKAALPEAQARRFPVQVGQMSSAEACLPGQGQWLLYTWCQVSSGWQGDTPPRDPLSQGSWVNTTPTHGPRWPSGCGDSLNALGGQVFTLYWFSIYLWKINLFLLVPSFCLLDEHKWSGSDIGHLIQKETRVLLLLCHLLTRQTKPSATRWWHP